MIGRLEGKLLAVAPPVLLIDVHGVGYEVEVPLSLLSELPAPGEPVTLVTHLQVSDSAQTLYGFTHTDQRELFRRLLKISGIGARLALAILSGIEPARLAHTVQAGDVQALTRIPGIGRKTAERLIMELRDRLAPAAGAAPSAGDGAGAFREACAALQQLGYKPHECERIVRRVAADGMSTEAMIRAALRQLGGRS